MQRDNDLRAKWSSDSGKNLASSKVALDLEILQGDSPSLPQLYTQFHETDKPESGIHIILLVSLKGTSERLASFARIICIKKN